MEDMNKRFWWLTAAGKLPELQTFHHEHKEDIDVNWKNPRYEDTTPLIRAVWEGHNDIVKWLVSTEGANVRMNEKDSNGWTALLWALDRENEEILEFLLNHGASVDEKDIEGDTALIKASRIGHVRFLERLLKYGADVTISAQNGMSPLEIACKADKSACANILSIRALQVVDRSHPHHHLAVAYQSKMLWKHAERGDVTSMKECFKEGKDFLDVDWKNPDRSNESTALIRAIENRHYSAVLWLLESTDVDLNKKDNGGNTALHIIMQWKVSQLYGDIILRILNMILKRGARIDEQNEEGDTALLKAIRGNRSEFVSFLLERNAQVNIKNAQGRTALDEAMKSGRVGAIELLFKYGATMNGLVEAPTEQLLINSVKENAESLTDHLLDLGFTAKINDSQGDSLLLIATRHGYDNVVSTLLRHGAGTDEARLELGSLLFLAASKGYRNIVELLLSNGADIGWKNKYQENALTVASSSAGGEVIDMLISAGSNVHGKDVWGESAILKACSHGHEEVVKILLDNGAPINDRNRFNESPLIKAARLGHTGVVKLLMESGAKLDMRDNRGYSALNLAKEWGHVSCVTLLSKAVKLSAEQIEVVKLVTGKAGFNPLYDNYQMVRMRISTNPQSPIRRSSERTVSGSQPQEPCTSEELAIAGDVLKRRARLRSYAVEQNWARLTANEYHAELVVEIDRLVKALDDIQESFPIGVFKLCKQRVSRNISEPLFDDPEVIYQTMSLSEWLCGLSRIGNNVPGYQGTFPLNYTIAQCKQIASCCISTLRRVSLQLRDLFLPESQFRRERTLERSTSGSSRTQLRREKTLDRNYSASSIVLQRNHLLAAVKELHRLGANPKVVAEEFATVALYTMDWPAENIEQDNPVTENARLYGNNPSFHGVMNWAIRRFRDPNAILSQDEAGVIEATLQIFLPLLVRLDVCLSRLPLQRATLYGGAAVRALDGVYSPGALIPWTSLISTSSEYWVTYEQLGESLLVVAHAHNASGVSFISAKPEELQHLLPTYAWVRAVSRVSPALLSLLESSCRCFTFQSVDDAVTMDKVIERLIPDDDSDLVLFDNFMSKYVESRVHPLEPPLPHGVEAEDMLGVLESFLSQETERHILLLGDEGCGKSTALLAAHYHLTITGRESGTLKNWGKPLISVFIPLSSIQLVSKGAVALDTAILEFLGVTSKQMDEILRLCVVVVMLDALDDCGQEVWHLPALLDSTKYLNRARAIMSCRTEFLSHLANPSSVVSKVLQTTVLHIQPFTRLQVIDCLSKALPDGCSLQEIERHGVIDELLHSPLALRMGAEILHQERKQARAERSEHRYLFPFKGMIGTRVYLYLAYLDTYPAQVCQHAEGISYSMEQIHTDLGPFAIALMDVAVAMLTQGSWQLPLSSVMAIFQNCFDGSRISPGQALRCSPLRFESLEDFNAKCWFWHKSFGEFLCAAAFCGDECQRYLRMTAKGSPFSLREPKVLSFFNKLILTDIQHRNEICENHLIGAVNASRDWPLENRAEAAVVASNALALLAISQYPLGGMKIDHLFIKDALIYEASLQNVVAIGSRFENCDFSGSDLTGAQFHDTEFVHCSFSTQVHGLRDIGDSVKAVQWSADGRYVALVSSKGPIRVLDGTNGDELKGFGSHTEVVETMCWGPNSVLLASCAGNTIRIWDVASGYSWRMLEGHNGAINSLCWSADGKVFLSGSMDGSILRWNLASGQPIKMFGGPLTNVTQLALAPGSKSIASASSDGYIRIWGVESGIELKKLRGHTAEVTCVCWEPQGRFLASGSKDKAICLWDTKTGNLVRRLEGHFDWISSLDWSQSGKRIISGSADKSIGIWETSTGHLLKRLEGHSQRILNVFCRPRDDYVISCSTDGTCITWNPSCRREVRKVDFHNGRVTDLCWSPDSQMLASASLDRRINLWDTKTGNLVRILRGHQGGVCSVSWSPCGNFLASGSDDRTLRIWNPKVGTELQRFQNHSTRMNRVSWSPNGKYIVSSADEKRICAYEMKSDGTFVFVRDMKAKNETLYDFLGSYKGNTVDKVYLDVKEEYKHSEVFLNAPLVGVCWSYDSFYVAASHHSSRDPTIRVFYIADGIEVSKYAGAAHIRLCWSPKQHLLAFGEANFVYVRDCEDHDVQEKKLAGHSDQVTGLCWSPCGKLIASSSSDMTVRIWDLASVQEVAKFSCQSSAVNVVSWSPDGCFLAAGAQDGRIQVWNVAWLVRGNPNVNEGVEFREQVSSASVDRQAGFLLGRNRPAVPPFRVSGTLGPESRNDPFLQSIFTT